jgi:hypothetical protein
MGTTLPGLSLTVPSLFTGTPFEGLNNDSVLGQLTRPGSLVTGIRVSGLVAASFEFGMSFSLPLEPELAPCGWHCPHWRLTFMGPLGTR